MVELTIARNFPTAETEARRTWERVETKAQHLTVTATASSAAGFVSRTPWMGSRPKTLVVACSDGRLQASVDEFLKGALDVCDYDRMYVPGGPGALVMDESNPQRGQEIRREFGFLLQAHQIENAIMLFHGAAFDGPHEAVCAYYRRLLPDASVREIARQQERDAAQIRQTLFSYHGALRVSTYRAEVQENDAVRFVAL